MTGARGRPSAPNTPRPIQLWYPVPVKVMIVVAASDRSWSRSNWALFGRRETRNNNGLIMTIVLNGGKVEKSHWRDRYTLLLTLTRRFLETTRLPNPVRLFRGRTNWDFKYGLITESGRIRDSDAWGYS